MSTWGIVGRREFIERGRDRGFVISTAITLVILVGFIVLTSLLSRGTSFDLGVVGESSDSVGRDVAIAGAALDVEIRVKELQDVAAAERAILDGDADAVLVNGETIMVKDEPPAQLVGLIQAASLRQRARDALQAEGLSGEEVDAALAQPLLPVDSLEPLDDRRRENAAVAFVGVLALYGQLFAYGYWGPRAWSRRRPPE